MFRGGEKMFLTLVSVSILTIAVMSHSQVGG
jgi:cell division protein FtsL